VVNAVVDNTGTVLNYSTNAAAAAAAAPAGHMIQQRTVKQNKMVNKMLNPFVDQ